jgi:hypothetical protein
MTDGAFFFGKPPALIMAKMIARTRPLINNMIRQIICPRLTDFPHNPQTFRHCFW